jgi:chromate transporter
VATDDDVVSHHPVSLSTVVREWTRIGCIGFGGPPAHIALLRQLCVEKRGWLDEADFEDAIAATGLLPGPASTQLAIWCAWRVCGRIGAVVGGLCFIAPGLVVILALSALFLASDPPPSVTGMAAGAGSAVAAVAVQAALGLVPASWRRARHPGQKRRWWAYLVAGAGAAIFLGPYLVVVLVAVGVFEVIVRDARPGRPTRASVTLILAVPATTGGVGALAWVALKVGALSYGGGFVIIALMRADAVDRYHWLTDAQFLNAVALGQITPGPVVHTVSAVGYAAGGLGGGLLAAVVAFTPSFAFVLVGARHFDQLRRSATVQAFLDGAGPVSIGAIAGSSVVLAQALTQWWQLAVLAAAAVWLLGLRRGVVLALLGAGAVGLAALWAGLPLR